jgi:hypothetical protein
MQAFHVVEAGDAERGKVRAGGEPFHRTSVIAKENIAKPLGCELVERAAGIFTIIAPLKNSTTPASDKAGRKRGCAAMS